MVDDKSKSRVYGDKIDLDSNKIKVFYDNRAGQVCGDNLSSVMLRSNSDNVAEKRNKNEIERINKLYKFSDKKVNMLDIGCGLGRMANNFMDKICCYNGIDFSKGYIEKAKKIFENNKNVNFYNLPVENINRIKNLVKYDLIVICGLCMYLNDDVLDSLFDNIYKNFVTQGITKLYVRESISIINERLTLNNFYSNELKEEYSAVYRTSDEYEIVFKKIFKNYKIISSDLILTKETGAREETNQRYWFVEFN